MPETLELLGKRFGKLVVIEKAPRNSSGKLRYLCQCDCGNQRIVISTLLNKGLVVSCGCLKSSTNRLYHIYYDMITRCYNKKAKSYKYYGYKGITVCASWRNSYNNFNIWALSSGYDDNLTIDRINSDGNYEPDNCRWIPLLDNQCRGFHTAFSNKIASGELLSEAEISYIKSHRNTPAKELAAQFHRCQQTIYNVWNGANNYYNRGD